MSSATAVADKVRSALARELRRDPATIAPEHALREDLGLNSLDAIELMFKVEEEFDLEIPDADLQRLRTVGDLVSYLEQRLAGAVAPVPPGPAPRAAVPGAAPQSPGAAARAVAPKPAQAAPKPARGATQAKPARATTPSRPAAKRRSGPASSSGKRSRT